MVKINRTMLKTRRIVLTCAVMIPVMGFGQNVMTLHDCMEYAVSNSTKMRIQAADRSDEQLARRDAILQAFTPSVGGSSYVYNNYGRAIDPETNTYVNTTSFNNGYSVSADITLFNGFQAVNNLRISATMEKLGLSKEQQAEDEICLATIQAFCNVLYYSELSKILEDQVAVAEKALLLSQRQESFGEKGHADVVQMEADLAEKQYTLVNTHNKKEDAVINLKDVMFYPIEEELIIDEKIAPAVSLSGENAAEIAEFAKSFNPSSLVAKGNMDKAKIEWRTAQWQLSPSLRFGAGWSTSYYSYPGNPEMPTPSFNNQFRNNMGEYLQFSLSIPIYDRFSTHSNIKRKKNAYVRASAEYDQKLRDIENEVYRAVNDRDGAEAAFNQADKLAIVQEEAFALNSRKFEQGLISGIEYQTASGKYLEAMASRLNAELQYYIKCAVVRYYNGESYINQ